jgi:hypothetical protein
MSFYNEGLRCAIANYQIDDVRKTLKNMSLEDKDCLQKENFLLDEAASRSQCEVMALLIEEGITKWFGIEENNRVFIRVIDDYHVDQLFGNFLQSTTVVVERKAY